MARGSIIKRAGIYYAVYRVNGKQKWERAGRTKANAQKVLARRMDEILSGGYVELTPMQFKKFAITWLSNYASIHVKESTFRSYRTIINVHLIPFFGDVLMANITTVEIQKMISQLITTRRVSGKTALNVLVLLRSMLGYAKLCGFIRRDPSAGIKRPKVSHREMDCMSESEAKAFLQCVSPESYPLFALAILTGLRRGELLGLQWGDIDWKSSELRVCRSLYDGKLVAPKSHYAKRRVALSPKLLDVLREYKAKCFSNAQDLVFMNSKGKPVDPDNMIKRDFLPALQRAGLRRMRFHDLRHTYASILISQGENVKYVQQQLGHSSAKTTLDRYGHLMPGVNVGAGKRLDNSIFGENEMSEVIGQTGSDVG